MAENGNGTHVENGGGNSSEENYRTETVDLGADQSLQVDISDALSEREKVKFTIHTKTTMRDFEKNDFSVIREHEEFIWLHNEIEEKEEYGGYIIPPKPPKPDFEASQEKLQKLGEGEATMTHEEFVKMRKELEQEYLATFKKTVSAHEVFLQRLAAHPVFREDANFRIFLEYPQDLSVRTRNTREKVNHFWKRFGQSADEVLLSGQKDVDDFFEYERNYMVEYHNHLKECTHRADKMTSSHKLLADSYIKVASQLDRIVQKDPNEQLQKYLIKVSDTLENSRKLEARMATDEDLKESDTLRYYVRETQAAKDLLYRRLRCLANYEGANKNLERARAKNKEVQKAEQEQQEACQKFEKITEVAKSDLQDLKKRRLAAFKKNLIDLAELQSKHAKAHLHLLKTSVEMLKSDDY